MKTLITFILLVTLADVAFAGKNDDWEEKQVQQIEQIQMEGNVDYSDIEDLFISESHSTEKGLNVKNMQDILYPAQGK